MRKLIILAMCFFLIVIASAYIPDEVVAPNWSNINESTFPVACPENSAITELNSSVTCSDYWIDSSVFRCFDVCPNVSNIFLLNENLSTDTIKQECQSFRLPYPVPPKIKFTEWNKVFIND